MEEKHRFQSECNETTTSTHTLPFSRCILLESCPPSWPARSPSFGPGKMFGDKPNNIWFMERPFWWTAASTCRGRTKNKILQLRRSTSARKYWLSLRLVSIYGRFLPDHPMTKPTQVIILDPRVFPIEKKFHSSVSCLKKLRAFYFYSWSLWLCITM